MITQSELHRLFTLNEKGELLWKRPSNYQSRIIGKVAGSLDKRRGYWGITVNGKHYNRSRLNFIYVHGWSPEVVDHVNRMASDDRIENLRAATQQQNTWNQAAKKKSGFKGVSWDRRNEKWIAQITINGKNVFLGRYDNEEIAAEIYRSKAKAHFGEFACFAESEAKK